MDASRSINWIPTGVRGSCRTIAKLHKSLGRSLESQEGTFQSVTERKTSSSGKVAFRLKCSSLLLVATVFCQTGCDKQSSSDQSLVKTTSSNAGAEVDSTSSNKEVVPSPSASNSLSSNSNASGSSETKSAESVSKKYLDYTALQVPASSSGPKDWIDYLSTIDKSMRELMRAVGSPDLPQEEALVQARKLSEMKLAAAEGLSKAAVDPKDADLGAVAKLEALAHAAGLGDASAASKLRILASQKKEIQSPVLAQQANIILLGFALSDLTGGLTDSAAVLEQLDLVLDSKEPLQQPAMQVALQTLKVLDQQSQTSAFAKAKEKIISAFRDNKVPALAMQAWSLDVNESDEMKLLNESLGDASVPAARVKSYLESMVKRSPTQWTIAWLLSNVSNIEYSGNIEHASAVMSTIEENMSLLKAAPLVEEAKPVIEGFKKRIGLIGAPLDFDGQKVVSSGVAFDPKSLEGKITLVDFWATWCGPCRAEFPNLRELYKKYHDKGFEIVGVNLDDTDDIVSKFFEKESLPWIHVRASDSSKEGFANPLAEKISITAIPFMVLLDKDGKVIQIHARGKRLEDALAGYFDN